MGMEGMPGARGREMTQRKCDKCSGTGRDSKGETCKTCRGTGKLRDS